MVWGLTLLFVRKLNPSIASCSWDGMSITPNDDVSMLLYYAQQCVNVTVLHPTMMCQCYCITPNDYVSLLLYYIWQCVSLLPYAILHFLAKSKAAHKTWGGVGWKKQSVPTLHSSQRAIQFQCAAPFPFTTQWHTHAPTHQFQAHDLYAVLEDPNWRPHQATERCQQVDLVGRTGHLVNSRTVNTISIKFVRTAEPSTPSSSHLSEQQNRQHHHHTCPNSRTVNIIITLVQTAEPSTSSSHVQIAEPSTSSSHLSKQQNCQHQVIIK